ncbi:MAG TPA: amino acid adenylation domain-containing protein, partial [Burkholderiaceae bacterium]
QLVERLNPGRSLSYAPLFQVSCSLVNTPVDGDGFPGIEVEPLRFEEDQGVARYDLTFNFTEIGEGIVGTMEYNTDLFGEQTIARMLGHYRRLLEAIVAAPEKALGELEILGDEERRQQIEQWNRTQRPYPNDCVHSLFEQQAGERPDAIAVIDGHTHLSYGELERRANRLAHHLIAQGVGVDSCVGLCVERSADMIVGLLGILKAGGAYVPLDPGHPESRLKHMIDTSKSRLILSEQHLLEELAFLSDYPALPLDGHWHEALLGRYPDTPPAVAVTPDNLAYVIFTSGSTGVPKGVLISHASIVSLVRSGDSIMVEADAIVGQAASYAFDAITYELWAPLLAGGRVVLIDKDTLLSPPALTACLRQQQIGALFITTALFNRISEEMPQAFATLKQVLFGGEAHSAQAIAQVLQEGAPQQLLHVYGPTESTTFATGYLLERERFLQDRQAPIGMPLANTTAYVMHGEQLAPLGAVGELCLGGDGLARGYLGDARLTASKFVPHPFAASPGQRLYRTGDLVWLRSDGAIEFKGRVDDQIKLRGFRIELGEIDQALNAHPGVEQGLVLVREDQPGERLLVAYVMPKSEAPEDLAAELASHLKGRVPDYAVPGAFVMLAAFPLNANGKIDRRQLPVPDESAYARTQYVAPATPLEERLAALWRANLGREGATAIGTQDNYFAIGGDSIRSISLVSSARAEGLQFAIKDLFAHPTIAELAAVVVEIEAEAEDGASSAIAPFALLTENEKKQLPAQYRGQAVVDAYPLSMLQQGMLFHSSRYPDSSVYHCVITFAIESAWQPAIFGRALETIIERHSILRTEFHLAADRPLQCVTAFREPQLEVRDLRDQAEEAKGDAIRSWVLEEQAKGLRVEELWRACVLLFRNQHIQFGLSFHHALWDGWSDATLVAELFACYKSLLQGESRAEQTRPPSYNRYIALEQEALAAPEHRHYWEQSLAQARQPWWSAHPNKGMAHFFCDISAQTSAGIISLADALRVQEKSVWCAVYLVLTSLIEGDDRILGSVVTHGRPEIADAEKMVGLFLNSLPIQADLRGATWSGFIKGVNAQLNQHQAHRHYPLAQIQVDLQLDFSASLFNFTNFHVISNSTAKSDIVGGSSFGLDDTNYLFSVDVQKNDAAGSHAIRIKLDPNVFDADFQERIRHYVRDIIEQMMTEKDAPIDKCRLLGNERDRLQQYGRGDDLPARQAGASAPAIHQLIEAQVARTPEAVAVVCEGQQLTYAELNARANRLAHYLRSRGV